jgi:hypothetical protein
MTTRNRNNKMAEIIRKEIKEMRRLFLSTRSALFIIVSLFCVVLYPNFRAYAQESLLCADDIEKYCCLCLQQSLL